MNQKLLSNIKKFKIAKNTLLSFGFLGFLISILGIFICFFIEPDIQSAAGGDSRVVLSHFGVYPKTAWFFNISIIVGGVLGFLGIFGILSSNIEEYSKSQSNALKVKLFLYKKFVKDHTHVVDTVLIRNQAPFFIKALMILTYAGFPFIGLITYDMNYYLHGFFAMWYFGGSSIALFLWGLSMLKRDTIEANLFLILPIVSLSVAATLFFFFPDRAFLGEIAHIGLNGILYVYLISKSINS